MLVKSTFPCCLGHSVPLHIDPQGMGYLHARGIVHTDLRSKNVFLELNNRVVITDFGLFSVAGLTAKSVRPGWLMIPQGWLPYLAPEILRSLTTQQDAPDSSRFTMATDMYAFGYVYFLFSHPQLSFGKTGRDVRRDVKIPKSIYSNN